MLSRIAVQYVTLIFHQHTEAKDVIMSKGLLRLGSAFCHLQAGCVLEHSDENNVRADDRGIG
jgi:hypothetical protein